VALKRSNHLTQVINCKMDYSFESQIQEVPQTPELIIPNLCSQRTVPSIELSPNCSSNNLIISANINKRVYNLNEDQRVPQIQSIHSSTTSSVTNNSTINKMSPILKFDFKTDTNSSQCFCSSNSSMSSLLIDSPKTKPKSKWNHVFTESRDNCLQICVKRKLISNHFGDNSKVVKKKIKIFYDEFNDNISESVPQIDFFDIDKNIFG